MTDLFIFWIRDKEFAMQGVQPLGKETEAVGVLESRWVRLTTATVMHCFVDEYIYLDSFYIHSMHSLSIAEEEQHDSLDEEEANYMRNSM